MTTNEKPKQPRSAARPKAQQVLDILAGFHETDWDELATALESPEHQRKLVNLELSLKNPLRRPARGFADKPHAETEG